MMGERMYNETLSYYTRMPPDYNRWYFDDSSRRWHWATDTTAIPPGIYMNDPRAQYLFNLIAGDFNGESEGSTIPSDCPEQEPCTEEELEEFLTGK